MIRVLVGTQDDQYVCQKVLEHSIRVNAREPVDVSFHTFSGARVGGTFFGFVRFLVPSLCGYAGRAIYLDHGAGLVTGYFHLSQADVTEGDTVAAGQRIGAVGRSGRVTGPHLHWILRYGSISLDPMTAVTLTSASPEAPAARPSDPPSPCSAS